MSIRHDSPVVPSGLGGDDVSRRHAGDAIWHATMKADALLGRISHDYRVQLGATFDWEVSDDDVHVARTTLSPQRVDALIARLGSTRPTAAAAPDWDSTADLVLL